MYIVIAFELTILFAALSAVFGLLPCADCPCRITHFQRAAICVGFAQPFFLCIEAADPLFDRKAPRSFWKVWMRGRSPKLRTRQASLYYNSSESSQSARILRGQALGLRRLSGRLFWLRLRCAVQPPFMRSCCNLASPPADRLRQDMQISQVHPLRPSSFFADGAPSVPGGRHGGARALNEDTAFYTGKIDGKPVEAFPLPITRAVLDRDGSVTTSTARLAMIAWATATA